MFTFKGERQRPNQYVTSREALVLCFKLESKRDVVYRRQLAEEILNNMQASAETRLYFRNLLVSYRVQVPEQKD